MKRTFGIAIAIDILALLCFFAAALFRYSANEVIPALAFPWELSQAFRDFVVWAPLLQFLGLSVALGSKGGKSEDLAQGALIPAVILSALLAAVTLVGSPLVSSRAATLSAQSGLFSSSLEAVKVGIESGELVNARAQLEVCQSIARNDPRVVTAASELEAAETKAQRNAQFRQMKLDYPQTRDPAAAKDYYMKALDFAAKGDYFAANWHASTALKLDPSYTDARRLAATSWEKLHESGYDPADKDRAAFYGKKLEGYGLLRSGDAVGAYGVFKELSKSLADKRQSDPDVRRYLEESQTEMAKVAFFKEEADAALSSTLVENVFLRIPSPPASARGSDPSASLSSGLRFLSAKNAAWAEGSLYLREFEYIETGSMGIRTQVRSPYAKLSEGKLFLVCVERDSPQVTFKPSWTAGPVSGTANLMDLNLSNETAYRAITARAAPQTLSLVDLWRAAREARLYGLDQTALVSELLARSAFPFAIFTAATLGALAGGRFRRRDQNFPRGLVVLVPLMALALAPGFLLAYRVDALISAWSFKMLPGPSSLFIAAGLRTLVLFLAVLLLAGARNSYEASLE